MGEVEQEKMQAIAAQNHLKSFSKQRESAQQDIQVDLTRNQGSDQPGF